MLAAQNIGEGLDRPYAESLVMPVCTDADAW